MAKEKNKVLTTPQGRAIYPHLTTPDSKFGEPQYKVKLAVKAPLADKLIKEIDEVAARALAEAKADKNNKKVKEADLPYSYDEENDEFLFNFKMKAEGKSKKSGETWTQKPAIFDAKGKPIVGALRIGGGSTLRVSFEAIPFFTAMIGAGVSLRLRAVKVIELKEFGGGGTAETHGFGEEEEGYTADEAEVSFPAEDKTEAPAASNGGDF
jgi:hypothetical protein